MSTATHAVRRRPGVERCAERSGLRARRRRPTGRCRTPAAGANPFGRPFDQRFAELAREPWVVVACGRHEGIDARLVDEAATRMSVDEISLGDYVLTGGGAAVLVILEAVAPAAAGVVRNRSPWSRSRTARKEHRLSICTKPSSWRGRDVPEILLSGHHANITRWHRDQALRPMLLGLRARPARPARPCDTGRPRPRRARRARLQFGNAAKR